LLEQLAMLGLAGAVVPLLLPAVAREVVQLAVILVTVHNERPVALAHSPRRPPVAAVVVVTASWLPPEHWLRAQGPWEGLALQHP
jgi:hypothetical protein